MPFLIFTPLKKLKFKIDSPLKIHSKKRFSPKHCANGAQQGREREQIGLFCKRDHENQQPLSPCQSVLIQTAPQKAETSAGAGLRRCSAKPCRAESESPKLSTLRDIGISRNRNRHKFFVVAVSY